MSWKCDICDSYNEDGISKCYVCGQPRSSESIKEEKEEKRKEFSEKFEPDLYKLLFGFFKVIYILCILLSAVAVCFLAISYVYRIGDNITLMSRIAATKVTNIFNCTGFIFSKVFFIKIRDVFTDIIPSLFWRAIENFEDDFATSFVSITQRILFKIIKK